jgi:hypothetical protein
MVLACPDLEKHYNEALTASQERHAEAASRSPRTKPFVSSSMMEMIDSILRSHKHDALSGGG